MENTSNITQIIIDTINTIFGNLFGSIDNSLYTVLDDLTFINSDILQDNHFEKLFGTSVSNGILIIANSLLFGFLLYYGLRYLLSHFTYHPVETPGNFVLKLIIYGIAMNFSFFILEMVLDLNSNITLAIRSLGENLTGKDICFSKLIQSMNPNVAVDTNALDFFTIDGLLKGTLSFSLLSLVLSYAFRYIMVQVFILLAPFAILSLSLNTTSWFFKSWAKNLFSLLLIQIIVSLVLLILFSIPYNSGDLFTKIIYLGGIYTLIKANSFVREFVGGISTTITQNVKNFSLLK